MSRTLRGVKQFDIQPAPVSAPVILSKSEFCELCNKAFRTVSYSCMRFFTVALRGVD